MEDPREALDASRSRSIPLPGCKKYWRIEYVRGQRSFRWAGSGSHFARGEPFGFFN